MGEIISYKRDSAKFYNSLKKYALSEKEAKECYEKGIITSQINNTVIKEYDDGFQDYITRTYPKINKNEVYSDGIYFKLWYSYLASLGIKMFFIYTPGFGDDKNNREEECIYITDFHLVFSKKLEYTFTGADMTKVYKKPGEVLIIPLNKIKNIELKLLGEVNYYENGYSYIKEGSPELGAIMGGAIAGATGAVVGAVANQTKIVNVPGKLHEFDEYSLIIKLDDGKILEFDVFGIKKNMKYEKLFKSLTLEGNEELSKIKINEPQYSDDSFKMINERLNFLLCRAQNKYSDEEMSNIAKRSIERGIEFNKKVEQDEKNSLIFGGIFFAVIFIILTIFQLYS